MHKNNSPDIELRHLCIGGNLSRVIFPHVQLRCPKYNATKQQHISFKAPGHRITEELYQYTRDLLAIGTYTNRQVAEITDLGKNTVKGIDEFKLHNGRRYATHIIDLETGHILWIANGKKKAEIVAEAILGPVTNRVPASVLQEHPNCIYLLDDEAASLLPADLPGLQKI